MVGGHAVGGVACVIGALVGDAAGAPLEFARRIDEGTVEAALRFPGGGALGVGPGQLTDDGELTLALDAALRRSDPPAFDAEAVAAAFLEWFRSDPFDCGRTTRCAFGFAEDASQMRANALKYNLLSEANGALMRTAPVPARLHRLPDRELADVARRAAALSHPSALCQDTAALYCVAVAHLVRAPGDRDGALAAAERDAAATPTHPQVLRWLLEDSAGDLAAIDCSRNIGHVKHAFTLAFHFLRRGTDYATALRQTLLKGGDTDTNACIVGGMVGAYSAPPAAWTAAVLGFDPAAPEGPGNPIPRPAACRAANAVA